MKRRPPTDKQRTAIFDAAGGVCHICSLPIVIGQKWDVEHIKPLWLDGQDAPVNMRPAHDHCHRKKTAREAFERAKGTRVRAKHLGAKKPKRAWGAPKAPKELGERMARLRQMREGRHGS